MSSENTDRIVVRVLAGEIEAYGEIVRRYQREVWKVVAAMLEDFSTSEDLVQQVFVNSYLRLDSYEKGRDFGHWIKGIARNLVKQELRRRSREARRLRVYEERLSRSLRDPDAEERRSALSEALRACLERLPEQSARVVELRYSEGIGFDRIGSKLGRTAAAARQLLARVRLKLRDCVSKAMKSR